MELLDAIGPLVVVPSRHPVEAEEATPLAKMIVVNAITTDATVIAPEAQTTETVR